MKKKYLIIEFSLIFFFFVLPPLFVNSAVPLENASHFSPMVLIQLILVLILETDYRMHFESYRTGFEKKIVKWWKYPLWFAITAAVVFSLYFLFSILNTFFPKLFNDAFSGNLNLPEQKFQTALFFISLAISALYEEMIYRQFIPFALEEILDPYRRGNKLVSSAIELAALILFALGHRYLGWMNVANAFLCGTMFRICTKKTGSIWTGFSVHLFYNIVNVLIYCTPQYLE